MTDTWGIGVWECVRGERCFLSASAGMTRMCGGSVSRKARRAATRSEAVPAGTAGRRAVPPTYKGGGIVAGTRGRLSAWCFGAGAAVPPPKK